MSTEELLVRWARAEFDDDRHTYTAGYDSVVGLIGKIAEFER